jgi:hypothetical protein
MCKSVSKDLLCVYCILSSVLSAQTEQ